MKKNKYQYLKVLQGCYEGKWGDLTFYDKNDPSEMKQLRADYKAYLEHENVPLRIINRREPIDKLIHA